MNRLRLVFVTVVAAAATGLASQSSAQGAGPSPVITAAGDISTSTGAQSKTASTILSINPAAVLTMGDNQYPSGALSDFNKWYDPSWGQFLSKTYPSPGNHDYKTSGASGYFSYFGSRAPAEYYSFDLGAWHLISLNSEIAHAVGSAQDTWLKSDLAAHSNKCVLAYWHKPRFASGEHGSYTSSQTLWADLAASKADIVLNGHDHDYERFEAMDAGGNASSTGMVEFVVGTGGIGLGTWVAIQAHSIARNNTDHGVLKLTLMSTSYDWEFVSSDGSYKDQGHESCH